MVFVILNVTLIVFALYGFYSLCWEHRASMVLIYKRKWHSCRWNALCCSCLLFDLYSTFFSVLFWSNIHQPLDINMLWQMTLLKTNITQWRRQLEVIYKMRSPFVDVRFCRMTPNIDLPLYKETSASIFEEATRLDLANLSWKSRPNCHLFVFTMTLLQDFSCNLHRKTKHRQTVGCDQI